MLKCGTCKTKTSRIEATQRTSVQQLLVHQLPAYIGPVYVARISVFISAETASSEFSEERPPLFCTTHLLNVELSPNGASRMRTTDRSTLSGIGRFMAARTRSTRP
jgi:hypothetical protein